MEKSGAFLKYRRISNAITRKEPDRVPITDFFWKGFIEKWKMLRNTQEDIYLFYDLDLVVQFPNIEPHVQHMEVLEQGQDHTLFRTGFGYTIKAKSYAPMPLYLEPVVKSVDDFAKVRFDDPADGRRFFDFRDDLINIGEGIEPADSFMESIERYRDNTCVFGGTLDPFEYTMRLRGQEELLVDLVVHQDRIKEFIPAVTEFIIENCIQQIHVGGVRGFFIGGDVAYDRGMLFSPIVWREIFKPQIKKICDALHHEDMLVIYHGCGNMKEILPDLAECGVDCVNPLQASAGLDVVGLKREYGDILSFMGNISVRDVLEKGSCDDVKKEVLRKLNAAKGGGYIAMSDHSVSSDVKIDNYEYMIRLIRDHGTYPLELGEYEEKI